MSLDPGQQLGPYEIQVLVGVGGMGEVYRGRDTRLNRTVALKVVSPQLASQEHFRERFDREALTISQLNHANVCTLFDVGHHEGVDFLVMEFVDGETLAERLTRGPLPPAESLDVALQIAHGLAHAHVHGIVHRDIKPANVMLTTSGVVKILDFGVAKWDRPDTVTQTGGFAVGTLAYMAPEQLLADGLVTPATDVWALGSVLYEMLSGARPFRGRDAVSLFRSILHDPPPPLDLERPLPAGLKQIIKRAVAKDPDERYPTAAGMADDLAACRAQLSSTGQFSRVERRRVDRRWLAVAAAVAIVGGGFGARAINQWRHQAWAREFALPEIQRLVDQDRYADGFALAQQAAVYLGADPSLARILPIVSVSASLTSEPPDATVSYKTYADVDGAWHLLGQTPLKMRLPRGVFKFKIEKPGYRPAYLARALTAAFEPPPIRLRPGSAGDDSVDVPRETLPVNLSGFNTEDLVELPAFSIDRTEVTNQAFKTFVDGGGYQDLKLWTHGGRRAVPSALLDTTGRPGPATWELGDFPTGHADEPVGGVSWDEAAAYCEFQGGQLPTIYHWARAALAPREIAAPLGPSIVPLSNFGGRGPAPAGKFGGMGPYGTYDMAGNLREWTWNGSTSGRRLILGGAWNDPDYMFSVPFSLPPDDRSAANGFRCMHVAEDGPLAAALLDPVDVSSSDYRSVRPVSDEVFSVFAKQFAYVPAKPGPAAAVEARDTTPSGSMRERVTLPVGYGDERMTVYVFMPAGAKPPYQAMIYFPALNAFQNQASSATFFPADYVARSGRALVLPVFKGSFERWDPALDLTGEDYLRALRLRLVQWRQDLGRTIDYLEARGDIDVGRIGYYGRSFGASMPLPLLYLEPRLKLAVFYSGGFTYRALPAETNAVNYVSRIKLPVLMLNGRHDYVLPYETSQRPLFDLFGSVPANKRQVVFDAGHDPLPRNQVVREILAWLDHYFGVPGTE